jgi:hypothetical protein
MKTGLENVSAAGTDSASESSTRFPKDLQGTLLQGGTIALSKNDNLIFVYHFFVGESTLMNFDELVNSRHSRASGNPESANPLKRLDSRFRGNDGKEQIHTSYQTVSFYLTFPWDL